MQSTTATLGNMKLTNRTAEHSPRTMARLGGLLYLLLAIVGELPLTFWLLIKGINVEQWKKRALESA